MPVDAYSPCPCGSGKKFKWCCQPFYDQIEKAFEHQANGQHEAALRAIDQLAERFPGSAEVWGRRAELLWENQRPEEAERSIDKALEINPNYAFGLFLRGMMRHGEGEVPGALLLYQQAAEQCDAEAHALLAEIHGSIGQCEIMMNRPLAARAAWQISLRHEPGSREIQNHLEQYFGADSPFPPVVRGEYRFLPQSNDGEGARDWEQALAGANTGKLSDAVRGFEDLTAKRPADAAAWYNLALARAWRGDNAAALESLDRYVALEPDDDKAAAAWALGEVLRFDRDLTHNSDYVEHAVLYRIADPARVGTILSRDRRIVEVQQARDVIGGSLLDRELPSADENLAGFQLPRLAAHLLLSRDQLRLSNPDSEALAKGRGILEELIGAAVAEPQEEDVPVRFDRALEPALTIRFPAGLAEAHARRLIDEHLQQYFEEKWSRRPLRSLNGMSPLDAAGHPVLKKKLLGVVQFMEELAHSLPFPYDFDRLRGKLGLPTKASPVTEKGRQADVTALGAAELASLRLDELSDEDLRKGFQAALNREAGDLAVRFAQAAVGRPPAGDRYAFFNHLIQRATAAGDIADAQSLLSEGLRYDCEHNEGRRRNEYEFRRAQLYLRGNEPEAAHEVLSRLVQRTPSDLDLLGRATESMLSARLPHHAREFAQKGLETARQKGDRDRAGYFQELLAAAAR